MSFNELAVWMKKAKCLLKKETVTISVQERYRATFIEKDILWILLPWIIISWYQNFHLGDKKENNGFFIPPFLAKPTRLPNGYMQVFLNDTK